MREMQIPPAPATSARRRKTSGISSRCVLGICRDFACRDAGAKVTQNFSRALRARKPMEIARQERENVRNIVALRFRDPAGTLRIFAKSGTRERTQNVILRQMPKETQRNPRWRENNTFLHRSAACDHFFAFLFWCERPLCARKTTFVCCNRADARARVPCACARVHTFFDFGVISPASWKSTTKGHVRKIM